jgi:hypothetical protein
MFRIRISFFSVEPIPKEPESGRYFFDADLRDVLKGVTPPL